MFYETINQLFTFRFNGCYEIVCLKSYDYESTDFFPTPSLGHIFNNEIQVLQRRTIQRKVENVDICYPHSHQIQKYLIPKNMELKNLEKRIF